MPDFRCLLQSLRTNSLPPMTKWILSGIAAIVAILLLPLLWIAIDQDTPGAADAPVTGLPWQIDVLSDGGSRVFGLEPGTSLLNDAIAHFGPDAEVAIIAPPGQAPALEAYFESVRAGFITARVILTVAIETDELAAMQSRVVKSSYMESATRKLTLHADDLARARTLPILAIAFIPSADLDEAVIVDRFGPPTLRIPVNDHLEHFLYPERGLDIALDARGKEILQYVAPRDFDRLSAPLIGTASDAAGNEQDETHDAGEPGAANEVESADHPDDRDHKQ